MLPICAADGRARGIGEEKCELEQAKWRFGAETSLPSQAHLSRT
jgi:hypothetical protein